MKSRVISLTVILFFILASIAATTPKTASVTNVKDQAQAAALSGKIIYDEESPVQQGTLVKTDIMTIDIATKAVANLTDNKDINASFCCPSGSLDGSKIAYCVGTRITDAQTNTEYWNSQLYIMDIDGKNQQKITVLPEAQGNSVIENFIQERYPAWSPDGKKIAFSSNRTALVTNEKFDDELFVMDLATKQITQLTNADGYSEAPTWSPDGKLIAFMSDRSGNWEIYIMNSDGTGTATQLTTNTTSERFPSWSHDGKNLVYTSDRDGNLNLYIFNLDTKTETRLTNDPADDFTGRWTPDDQWVVFGSTREGAQKIFMINVATKEEIKITDNQVNDRFQNWVPNPPVSNQVPAAASGAPASSEGSNTTNSNPTAPNTTAPNNSGAANPMCTQFNLTPEECANLGTHDYTFTSVATFNPKGCGQGTFDIKLTFVFSEGGKLTMQVNGGELNYTRDSPNNFSGTNMITQTNSKTNDKLVFNNNGFNSEVILYTLKDGAHKCTWEYNYTLKN